MQNIPVSSIPNEVLGYIFEQQPSGDAAFLVLISSVSRHWREVAFGMPLLWANMSVDERPSSVDRFCAFLERSSECPISVRMCLENDLIAQGWGKVLHYPKSPILAALEPHFSRLDRLSVTMAGTSTCHFITRQFLPCLCRRGAPRLRRLTLRAPKATTERGEPRNALYHLDSVKFPSLTHLTLAAHLEDRICDIHLRQLTKLDLSGWWHLNGQMYTKVMNGVSSLSHLVISSDTLSSRSGVHSASLPDLRTLTCFIGEHRDMQSLRFLGRIMKAPSVETVNIVSRSLTALPPLTLVLTDARGLPLHPNLRMLNVTQIRGARISRRRPHVPTGGLGALVESLPIKRLCVTGDSTGIHSPRQPTSGIIWDLTFTTTQQGAERDGSRTWPLLQSLRIATSEPAILQEVIPTFREHSPGAEMNISTDILSSVKVALGDAGHSGVLD